jgi:hypothetical protein
VPLTYRHYSRFFGKVTFAGPVAATVEYEEVGQQADHQPVQKVQLQVEGYDMGAGTMQYTSLRRIIERAESGSQGTVGYMSVGDDFILQPWALVGLNRSLPWAPSMGIAHADNWRAVKPVTSMAMERRRRTGTWGFWIAARPKLVRLLDAFAGGAAGASSAATPSGGGSANGVTSTEESESERNLRLATALTPQHIFTESSYADSVIDFSTPGATAPPDNGRMGARQTHWRALDAPRERWQYRDVRAHRNAFYAIMDCYYIPSGAIAQRWVRYAAEAERIAIHLETAIPTTMRMASAAYEVLAVQYYWRGDAVSCARWGWHPTVGLHRCRHDHKFARALYEGSEAQRLALGQNVTRINEMRGAPFQGIDGEGKGELDAIRGIVVTRHK